MEAVIVSEIELGIKPKEETQRESQRESQSQQEIEIEARNAFRRIENQNRARENVVPRRQYPNSPATLKVPPLDRETAPQRQYPNRPAPIRVQPLDPNTAPKRTYR